MQSGITGTFNIPFDPTFHTDETDPTFTASEELHAAFKDLLASPSRRGLLVSISKSPEVLVPAQTISSTSSDFTTDLSNLEPHIKEDVATYVLLREVVSEGTAKCIAITYVPERAPVRSKMLFASTRLTLVRELGTEHFVNTLFATNPGELTPAGWTKHLSHEAVSAPMTTEEASLAALREAEASESTGTSARRGGHVSKNITLPITDDAAAALSQLKSGALQLVQLAIDVASETLTLGATSEQVAPGAVGTSIDQKEPRYTFYKPDEGGDGLLFVYTCPSTASIKQRMLYASSRQSTVSLLAPEHGLEISGKLEAGDPEDITEEAVLAELGLGKNDGGSTSAGAAGSGAGRGGFARPKRPGRR